jgi:hypothetical protein
MTAEILSRPRLSRMIDDLGLYKEESQYLLREEVISTMRDNLRVEPVIPELESESSQREYEINQFRIYFRDDDATVARGVAQALADDFIEEHIDAREGLAEEPEFVDWSGAPDRADRRGRGPDQAGQGRERRQAAR